jgi:hypothetical protein
VRKLKWTKLLLLGALAGGTGLALNSWLGADSFPTRASTIAESLTPSVARTATTSIDSASLDSPPDRQSGEANPQRSGASLDLTLPPSEDDLTALRSVRRYAKMAGIEPPAIGRMEAARWTELRELVRQASKPLADLAQQRSELLMSLTLKRAADGTLEATHFGRSINELPIEERNLILAREKANHPDQLVAYHFAQGIRYVNRVNAGENQDIDNLTRDIKIQSTLLCEAVRQIAHFGK